MKAGQSLSYFLRAMGIFRHSAPPADLVYFVTPYCNCRCSCCLFKDMLNDVERQGSQLKLEEVQKIAANYGGPVVKLSLSGGEPFLREDIVDIVEAFSSHCGTRIVDIPTNGSMPDVIEKQILRMLKLQDDIIVEVQLSIDGTREVHDGIRGVPGLYDIALDTYEKLAAIRKDNSRVKIKLNALYQIGNLENIEPMYKELVDKGYRFDRFQVVYPHGAHIEDDVTRMLDYEHFYSLSQRIQKTYPIYDKKDIHSMLFRAIKIERDNILRKTIKRGDMGRICRAGKRNIVLDDIGNVYPCEPMWKSLGNVRDYGYSMERVIASEGFRQFKRRYWGSKKCNCTWGNIALDDAIYNPLHYPKIIYNLAKLLAHK